MDQREQTNQPIQPERPQADEERVQRQRRQAERIAQEGPSIRAESIVQVRAKLDDIEAALDGGTRVPFRSELSMLNVDMLRNLLSQVRIALPHAVEEAAAIIRDKQQIEFTAQQRAQERTSQAAVTASETIAAADAQARQTLEDAQQRALEIEQRARATAEKLLVEANAEAARRTEDSEITRRAHARAKEIFDQVQLDVDGMYKAACNDINTRLVGASAALSRNAMELENLRSQLLGAGGEQSVR